MKDDTGHALSAADLRAIETLHAKWQEHERAGNVRAVLDLCAETVVWLPPDGRPLRGRDTILHWLSGPPGTVEDLQVSNLTIGGRDGVAWTTCEYVTRSRPPGAREPVTVCGTQLWVLAREGNGAWRIVAASWTEW